MSVETWIAAASALSLRVRSGSPCEQTHVARLPRVRSCS